VVVFDADGRVDEDFFQAVTPLFADPNTASVQSAVRMHNAERNLLTYWQHFEFVVCGELFSRAKDRLGSATLGGNGQCVRLSALRRLGPAPWRPSLTEDLDLSLRLLMQGYRLRFCPAVAVWQEAVTSLRPLIRQRSRWFQGHLVTWVYLPALWRSPLPWQTRLDLTAFLLLPAAILPIGLTSLSAWALVWLNFGLWNPDDVVKWYILGFGAAPLLGEAWYRVRQQSRPMALVAGHIAIKV
jgi:1,2-diacylglycerol 3-beta-glucosyltransferase